MSNAVLTRDRGCGAYFPWICLVAMLCLGAGTGAWIAFGLDVYNSTNDGLNELGVDGVNVDRGQPAIIASATISLVLVVLIFGLAVCRSSIERGHDRTGVAGGGSRVYMVMNVMMQVCWWIAVIWLVLLIQGASLWTLLLYVSREGIDNKLDGLAAILPAVPVWGGPGTPCPDQCLDLSQFYFITESAANACICSYTTLQNARNDFQDALNSCNGMLPGVWVMWISAAVVLVDMACGYSHTKRERDYLNRALAEKPMDQFSAA